MKAISILVMVCILVSSIVPVTYADDTADTILDYESNTQNDIVCMGNYTGSAIRLLQLEKALTINIMKGEATVEILQTLLYNTTSLEAILVEFELLIAEVKAADPNSSDAVQMFVDLKSDAIELTKEFRETLHLLVDEDTEKMLQERIQGMISEQAQNLSIIIKNQIRHYNRNQLYRLYGYFGDTNESIIEEYHNGTVAWTQVRAQIRFMVNNMTKEHRNELFTGLKESHIRTRIQSNVCLENVTDGFHTRKESRLNLRLHLGQNMTHGQIRSEFEKHIKDRMHANTDDGSGDQQSGNGNGNNGSGTGGQQSGDGTSNNGSSNTTSGNGNGLGESQGPGGGGQP
ncbi:MAG: hypothetical protein V1769_05610 [Thermoplasmatota archaeon]